jgi:hypothetical protein
MFPKNARYKTLGIDEAIGPELQRMLWNLIDMRLKQKAPLDYLQVFELHSQRFAGSRIQQIVHRQEQPPYRKIWQWECRSKQVHGVTVWVMDSGEYCTMLLPTEY